MGRPKHQRKELEALLKEAEAQGWFVARDRLYFELKCPCPGEAFHHRAPHAFESEIRAEQAEVACPSDMLGGEVMRYTVTQGFHVGLAHDELEPHLDSVLETLMELGAEDADIGGSLASGEIEISLTVDAGSLRDAQKTAAEVIAEAIRLAGGTTAEGDGASPTRAQGPSFDLRSIAAELAGT